MRHVGAPARKLGGERFLTGSACYLDDIRLTGVAHLALLRSPHAHARLLDVDVSEAISRPEAMLVLEGRRVAALSEPIPPRLDPASLGGRPVTLRPLAVDKVVYQGEPVAAAVAPSAAEAEALLELIRVRYEPLPAVLEVGEALSPGAPRLYEDWPDNVVARFRYAEGDVTAALAASPRRLGDRLEIQRYSSQPLETRGYLADYNTHKRCLTLYSSSQNPHPQRLPLAQILRLAESQIRIIAPDLGGGFGMKMHTNREEPLVCLASMLLGRPVKWIAGREEELVIAGREQQHDFEVGFDARGRLLALRVCFWANIGAFSATPGWGMARLTALTFPGGYKVPASEVEVIVVATNKGPWNPCRGYGKEATAIVLEHILDRVARATDTDPAEIRRRNFVSSSEFPYRTNSGLRLDSGDYHGALELALEHANYQTLKTQRAAARRTGRLLGIGLAFEVTPEAADFPGTMVGGFDSSTVRVDPSGAVTVLTGITSPGTGNDTAVAQVVADALGLEPEEISVVQGDTSSCPYGFGNGNGRSTIMGCGSAALAVGDVRAKLATVAAALLGVAADQVCFSAGRVGAGQRSLALSEVAYAAYTEAFARARGVEPPLSATRTYRPGNIEHDPDEHGRIQPYTTFSNAAHVSLVEVDWETGKVRLLRHVVVDDCGTMINPRAVAGQMEGAIAMGIGGALCEQLRYDDLGRLRNETLKSYLMPRASDVPQLELRHQITPSPFTTFGEKGAGEAGVGGAIAAILNAVNDALAPLGMLVRSLPLSAPNLLALIESAGDGRRNESEV